MTTRRKHKSDAFEAIHSAVVGMDRAGTIDEETMRDFDETCLVEVEELSPTEIKKLRENNHPSGAALKLLKVVKKRELEVLQ